MWLGQLDGCWLGLGLRLWFERWLGLELLGLWFGNGLGLRLGECVDARRRCRGRRVGIRRGLCHWLRIRIGCCLDRFGRRGFGLGRGLGRTQGSQGPREERPLIPERATMVGDYATFTSALLAAWKTLRRSGWGTEERATLEQHHAELRERRDRYLRALLDQLPFRWYVAHAYTPRETASHGGADHVIVDEEVRIGRVVRQPGDALSRPAKKFWGLARVVGNARLPTALADIKIAERIAATLQTS